MSMATAIPATHTGRPSSIAKFISKIRGYKDKDDRRKQERRDQYVATRPTLLNSPLPLVLPEHQQALSNLGWTTITFPQQQLVHNSSNPGPHPLQSAYVDLLSAAQAFFAQPAEEKLRWKHKLGSEEGWSSIPGEKEFITLRTLDYCPEMLHTPAKRYWDLMGGYLEDSLGRIAVSLNINEPHDATKGLKKFVGPCGTMQQSDQQKTATMLRLFRYEGWEAKEVAEAHADLGLLSAVVGNVPGLEVWDGANWFDVEREVARNGSSGATLLVGRQLETLTNGRFPAGGHRVVSYGSKSGRRNGEESYRYSIVFVLRAYGPAIIDARELQTDITGKWPDRLEGLTAGELYANIRSTHFNINIGIEEREKQRQIAMNAQMQGESK